MSPDTNDCASVVTVTTSVEPKEFATAQARAALAGVIMYRIEADNGRPAYVVTRWALTRQFEDLQQVNRWLDMVTGKR